MLQKRLIRLLRALALPAVVLGLVCCGPSETCKTSADCGEGRYCWFGRCQQGCSGDKDCAKGMECVASACQVKVVDQDKDGHPLPGDCDDNDPAIHPGAAETCGNDKDDDCDGKKDEQPCRVCVSGQSEGCFEGDPAVLEVKGTRCKRGVRKCGDDGVWSKCTGQVLPAVEECNGKDDDCDGQVDEGSGGKPLERECYSAKPETRGVGECRAGRQGCTGGVWAKACAGETVPANETCNGKDDNCDGATDEGVCSPP